MKIIVPFIVAAVASAELTINSFANANAGADTDLTWSYDGNPPISKMNIDLVNGNSENLKLVISIAADVDPTAKTYTWKVPLQIDNANDYAIRATATSNGATIYRFTSRFTVQGGTGLPTNTTTNPTTVSKSGSTVSTSVSKSATSPTIAYVPQGSASAISASLSTLFFISSIINLFV